MPDQPTGPLYRFHGRTPPQPGAKTEVFAAADVVDVVEGVATMRIYDPIDSWGGEWGVSAKEFAKALDTLPDDTAEIRLHINSPGGEVYEGWRSSTACATTRPRWSRSSTDWPPPLPRSSPPARTRW
jgi:hypothetical protein